MSREQAARCAAALAVLDRLTPLKADCGRVCDAACCRECDPQGEPSGMRLFPGEAAQGFVVKDTPDGRLLLCGGRCRREERPLACRFFPLFPYLGADGRVRAVYDPRAYRVCPLVRLRERVPLDRGFVRAVRRAGRILAAEAEQRAFLRGESQAIDAFNAFLKTDTGRPPIARRRKTIKQEKESVGNGDETKR